MDKHPSHLPTHLEKELINSYQSADYHVFSPLDFTIKIGGDNTALHTFLEKRNLQSWTFITAWNPFSKEATLVENKKQNSLLEKDLIENKLNFYQAEGRGGGWSEKSFFVENISKELAVKLAEKYKQNAILFGEINKGVELVFCV